MGGVALDLHAPAAAVALLAAPEFAVEEGLIDLQSSGQAGQEGDQSFAVRLSCCEVAQHKFSIVQDGKQDKGFVGRTRALRAMSEAEKYARFSSEHDLLA